MLPGKGDGKSLQKLSGCSVMYIRCSQSTVSSTHAPWGVLKEIEEVKDS